MALDLQDKRPANDEPVVLSEDAKRKQRLRSLAIAWALFGLAVMFFLVTLVRLGANVPNRPI